MKDIDYHTIHPREVADKADKDHLQKAIEMALAVESEAVRKGIGVFNTNRYAAVGRLPDYEALRRQARDIKEKAMADLPQLIENVQQIIEARGGHVYLARTTQEANLYVKKICLTHQAKRVVKSKSMTSEEMGLNPVLEAEGIDMVETDLAEFILQVSGEQPSHGVAPAIHRSRERISELFRKHFETDLPLDTGEDLTRFARDILREKFLSADVGISGANMIAADAGAILLVESEGNIRLTTHLPAIHIAIAGIEKIIHHYNDLGVFVELLAASATGQPLTSYTNLLSPPLLLPILNCNGRNDTSREFHLVLIDNGRMEYRDDPVLGEALYCIRCGACNNVCANFQNLGGHAFGGECYSGGIGGAWTAITNADIAKARFAELCSGCSRCIPNCPVMINIPGLNSEIKQRLMQKEGGPGWQKKFFAYFPELARYMAPLASVLNQMNRLGLTKTILRQTLGIARERNLPDLSRPTLQKAFRKEESLSAGQQPSLGPVILLADVFTNFQQVETGLAARRVLEKLGWRVKLSRTLDDGRAALSQGMMAVARRRTGRMISYLESIISDGLDVLILEPSVLTMFRQEYGRLSDEPNRIARVSERCYDLIEYLNINRLDGKFALPSLANRPKVFYHGHCQLKSIGLGGEVQRFFKAWGLDVWESGAECCGMAGSFGYKKNFYSLSKTISSHLGEEIRKAGFDPERDVMLASGISCREQLNDEMAVEVMHPVQLIDRLMDQR